MTSTASSKPGNRRGPGAALLLAFALTLTAADARAGDPAIAETLFREGKGLMKRGDYARACPKLAESQRLDPASGTLLALALCREKEGKVATAWAKYLEAEALARTDGNTPRAQAAQKRAAALEPTLAKLELVVGEDLRALPGLEIRLDGVILESAVWTTAVPVDPGERLVEAVAEGKKHWQATITITQPAERQAITIGPLEDLPPEPEPEPPPPAPVAPTEASSALWVAGGVIGGLGVVALGVGTFFGVRALDHIGDAQDRCPTTQCSDPEAVDLNDSGALSADLSTGLIIGGGVATAAGIVLLVMAGMEGGESAEAAGAGLRLHPLIEAAAGTPPPGRAPDVARRVEGIHGVVATYGGAW